MKIAIYEPVHLDWVVPYMELLIDEQVEFSFFTHIKFKNDLEGEQGFYHPKMNWYFFDTESSILELQKHFYRFLRQDKFDLIILNSIESRHLVPFFNLLLFYSGKVIINVHELNNFFLSGYSLRLKNNIRSIGKKALNTLSDGFIVNAKAMKEYIEEKHLTRKPVYWLPPVFHKEVAVESFAKEFTIVVPGTIDKRRRDYELVMDAMESICNGAINIKLVLAGTPSGAYGEKIKKRGEALNDKGCNVITFDAEVPEKEFQSLISSSTLIISPLVYNSSIFDGIEEIYGLTKASGTIYDAIRHGKPLMLPEGQNVPEEIKTSCIFYKSKEDFTNQLTRLLIQDALLQDYIKKAKQNAQYFSKAFTAGKLRAILNDFSKG